MDARIVVVGGTEGERKALLERLRAGGAAIQVADDPVGADMALLLGGAAPIVGVHSLALLAPGDDVAARLDAALGDGVDAALPLSVSDAVLAREVVRQLEIREARRRAASGKRGTQGLIEIERLLAAGASLREVLAQITIAMAVDSTQAILDHSPAVLIEDHGEPSRPETLDGHPEARAALATGEVVASARASAFPIVWREHVVGVMQLRHSGRPFDEQQIRFGRVLAGLLAPLVAGGVGIVAPEPADLSDGVVAQRNVERRLRAIEKFRPYFEAAADSVLVLDGEGRILFVNQAARTLMGFAPDALAGKTLADIVPAGSRAGLAPVLGGVLAGKNLEAFDLPVLTARGETLWVSVSTSTMLAEHSAAILLLRDVTSERRLEAELRKTKEFLEKLIDSTVDAIIAADISGTIILYNPGAERIFGWPAEDVIGRMSVEKFYPDGVARQIMRMLRSPSYGGTGRLELTRREILTRTGDIVPVNMTASIIYEGGEEVATVGILSDLRERIRIEQRLLMAQEKLLVTEKQAVIAELAGAAAHELNQPLTSVTLYIEMMQRRMPADDVNQRAVQAIARESERMAEIVKKIGRITRYETKQYVGGASILDLEKSSETGGVGGVGGGE